MNAAVASPAGFWKRYVAYCIDAAVLGVVLMGVLRLCVGDAAMREFAALQDELARGDPDAGLQQQVVLAQHAVGLLLRWTGYVVATWVVLGGAYFSAFECSRWQASPGKRLVGIKVVDAVGARLTPARALARFFAASLSWLTMNLGHALAAWTPERRALHDYLAGTFVVNADPARPGMPWWGWLIVAANALAFIASIVVALAVVWRELQTAAGL